MDTHVVLAHGSGGQQTAELIAKVFQAHFKSPLLTADDAAVLPFKDEKLAFSTDGFIVTPYQFPGGDIGKLSVCGTVNDLSCMGAKPLWLSCAFILEEGFPLKDLEAISASMQATAEEAGVQIVVGDTKVAAKGQVDQIFITTSGLGLIQKNLATSGAFAKLGDAIIVTGDIGRHGAAILLAREQFGLEAQITSDCAPLWDLVSALSKINANLHVIRDATRGGVGTVLYEIATQSKIGLKLLAEKIPVQPAVQGLCQMLGLDPLYLACEGRLVIMAPQSESEKILDTLHQLPNGQGSAIIGYVDREIKSGQVAVETILGATTLLPRPTGELLPRIC